LRDFSREIRVGEPTRKICFIRVPTIQPSRTRREHHMIADSSRFFLALLPALFLSLGFLDSAFFDYGLRGR
jgi:hypothetical protein